VKQKTVFLATLLAIFGKSLKGDEVALTSFGNAPIAEVRGILDS